MPALSGFTYKVYTPSDAVKAVQSTVPGDSDFVVIGGLQEKGLEFTATDIEITNDSSGENRELLDGHGIRSYTVTLNGFVQNSALHKALEVNSMNQKLRWFRMIQPDNANRKYTGKFKISSLTNTGSFDNAITFSATLTSSGPLTIS